MRWWADRSANRFHVTLAPGASLEAVRHAIATEVGAGLGLKVLTQRELYAYHQDAVRRAFRLTDALEILPLVVAALGLAEALLAVSLDRRHEFAVTKQHRRNVPVIRVDAENDHQAVPSSSAAHTRRSRAVKSNCAWTR